MAHVLVTGASGFIGQQLVAALVARGDAVTCLVRAKSTRRLPGISTVRLIAGDVTDPASLSAALDGVDAAYHLAGATRGNTLAQYCAVNDAGVRNIIEACARRTSPPVVLFVSSLAAAGPTPDVKVPRTEVDVPSPVSNYGRSKRAGELAAEAWAGEVPITIVRPPVVLGFGDRTGLALFRNIRRFRSFVVFGRKSQVSVIHVTDLTAALIAAAERGQRLPEKTSHSQPGEQLPDSSGSASEPGRGYYFVATEEHPTAAELCRMIARSVQRPRAWAIRMPMAAIRTAGAMGQLAGAVTFRPRYLNIDRIREMTAGHWNCSSEKARRELGFVCGASLPERIQQTAQWYRELGWL
jgi:nucleoside-diphosphate-sugar epimerase